jgi:membrane protease YdiL (CAAX protease family)
MSMGAAALREIAQRPLIAFSTPMDAAPWKRWLVYSPLARIAIFSVVAAGLAFLAQLAFIGLGWSANAAPSHRRATGFFLSLVLPTLGAYLFLVLRIERRRPAELAWRKLLPHGAMGTVLGALLISAVVGVLWLSGSYQVVGTHPDAPWVTALLVVGLASAIAEELVFRGILFRITEEGLGTWAALAVSALMFGVLHLANNGATAWSSMAIAIEAGLFLGLIYHVTRSLPLCMGVHLGWNFAQGTVYGVPVWGAQIEGWLVSTRAGPDWLSGGAFGAEASVVTVGLSLLCSLALVAVALRRHALVAPQFGRVNASAARPSAG